MSLLDLVRKGLFWYFFFESIIFYIWREKRFGCINFGFSFIIVTGILTWKMFFGFFLVRFDRRNWYQHFDGLMFV